MNNSNDLTSDQIEVLEALHTPLTDADVDAMFADMESEEVREAA